MIQLNLNTELADNFPTNAFTSSINVAQYLRTRIYQNEVEEVWVLALNSQCHLIDARMIFKGTVDQCPIYPRDIFRFGLLANSSFLILGHNHPSGNPQPSHYDITITKKLMKIGRLIQIPILDHVIVCKDRHFSFLLNNASFA